MTLLEWIAELERRAAQAEAVGATAPLALTYRAIAAEAASLVTNGKATEASPDWLLGAKDVAARLDCSVRYVYANANKFPFTRRVGSLVRFSEHGLEEWLRRRAA